MPVMISSHEIISISSDNEEEKENDQSRQELDNDDLVEAINEEE